MLRLHFHSSKFCFFPVSLLPPKTHSYLSDEADNVQVNDEFNSTYLLVLELSAKTRTVAARSGTVSTGRVQEDGNESEI